MKEINLAKKSTDNIAKIVSEYISRLDKIAENIADPFTGVQKTVDLSIKFKDLISIEILRNMLEYSKIKQNSTKRRVMILNRISGRN